MLTIDWKERLKKDAASFFESKLPSQNYDFEIIFNAYPARVNGKIPTEVIGFVAQILIQMIGKNHERYIPFYKHLWDKKGEYGKQAFVYMLARLINKKPEQYFPMVESAIQNADAHDVILIMDKIFLPLLKKDPEHYLPILFRWTESPVQVLRKQAMNLLLKYLKKDSLQIPLVLAHFQKHWNYSTEPFPENQILFLKSLGKIDHELYLSIYEEYGHTREPQTVEILCAAIYAADEELEPIVDNWTRSGNARVKKAALSAKKVLGKKK
ncbi:MAG: hypothetical protein PHI68_01480 [Candidatus Cloacimonetes bacterium]|nr:hypothetical protein [Candidatus Cloacimonadota bacterium]